MEIQSIKTFARNIIKLIRDLEELRGLLKKDGGVHLNDAGKAVIEAAMERGMTQTNVARLLGITSSAVSRHANR